MGNRYGRNQKRAAREKITLLEQQLAKVNADRDRAISRAWDAEYKYQRARESALRELLAKGDHIEYAVRRISEELARALGPELLPHAQKLMASDRLRKMPIEFSADVDPYQMVDVIRGEIPALRYNIALF